LKEDKKGSNTTSLLSLSKQGKEVWLFLLERRKFGALQKEIKDVK
jgi:hypothetical protein